MNKTAHASYCINGITEGCRHCVRGRKLVLFITGKCSRNCFFCSLSTKRKNKDIVFANERECKSPQDAVLEAIESNAKGVGVTGGDPLVVLDRTISYLKALKEKFGDFHSHIYLPTKLVNNENLTLLSKYIDEVRFHPSFIEEENYKEAMQKDIEKIMLAYYIFKKENIGCEFPILPDRKKEILEFIEKASPILGFVNLNELEISETNFEEFTKRYTLNKDTYTISGSKEAGLWILNECEKKGINIKIHLCTADTKNQYQYKNRLLLHKTLPYSYKTKDGSMRYFAICCNTLKELKETAKKLEKYRHFYLDSRKKRIILSEKIVQEILEMNQFKIARVEEFPTFDRIEIEFEYLQSKNS
jgi:uncharacterized protein